MMRWQIFNCDGHLADDDDGDGRTNADPSSVSAAAAAAAPHVTALPQRGKGYCRFFGTRNGECGVSFVRVAAWCFWLSCSLME